MEDHPVQAVSDEDFKKFMEFHELQLYGIQFPKSLERKLYDKLKGEVFDIGFKVKIMVDEEEERSELQCQGGSLKKHEDVFLVDHLWTFKQRDAVKALRANDKLLERMLNIIKYQDEKLELPTNPYAKVRASFIDYVKTFHDET
jgi:hypothetical protein